VGNYKKCLLFMTLILTISVFPFYIGYFSSWFNANICYSSALSNITSAYGKISWSSDPNRRIEFENFLKGIPNHGYESDCSEIEKYTASFHKNIDTMSPSSKQHDKMR
jgi:hypothetical protein